MNYSKLRTLKERFFFTVGDIADLFGIKPPSARVLCSRYVRDGIFVRLKNNLYVLEQNWDRYSRQDFIRLANIIQVPSYVSFSTALSFYEVTTQVPGNFFESACLKRSVKFQVRGTEFAFYKLKKELYFDFVKQNDYFIATKEKAFLDAAYLYSFGKYKLDLSALDIKKLDKNRLTGLLKRYPAKTRDTVRRICRI